METIIDFWGRATRVSCSEAAPGSPPQLASPQQITPRPGSGQMTQSLPREDKDKQGTFLPSHQFIHESLARRSPRPWQNTLASEDCEDMFHDTGWKLDWN